MLIRGFMLPVPDLSCRVIGQVGTSTDRLVLVRLFLCPQIPKHLDRGRAVPGVMVVRPILLGKSLTRGLGRERIRVGGFMDILAALKQEEAKVQ
jgi:hypothetical protein